MRVNLSQLVPRPEFLPQFTAWSSLRGLRIGLTGHRGLLGSLLLKRLTKSNVRSMVFDGDILNETAVSHWIELTQPDLLFHLAAIVPLRKVQADPAAAMRVNATSLLAISEAIATFAPRCWVFLGSTSHVYEAGAQGTCLPLPETSFTSPASLYGATKLAGERIMVPLAEHFDTRLCVGRIFSFFHERQSVAFLVPSLVERIEEAQDGGKVEVRDADAIRDFLYADMVIDAALHLCAARHVGTVNIASGEGTSVGEIADRIAALSGRRVTTSFVPSDRRTILVADVGRLRSIIALREER